MLKVSICIPTYENLSAFQRLMNSIRMQKYHDFEVIITDDSRNDDIMQEFYRYEDMDIHYYKNPVCMGAAANWNESIKHAKGEYIKIMHHDDWFTNEDSLQLFVDMLDSHPDAVMAFSGSVQVSVNNRYERYISDEDANLIKTDCRNLYLGNTIGAPSAVIHRKTEAKYDVNLSWLVDSDYYLTMLKEKNDFVYTKLPLISIGISDTQLTEKCIDNAELNTYEYGYVYEKHHLYKEKLFQQKLITVFLDYKKDYNDLRKFHTSHILYTKIYCRKFMSKVKYKLQHLW